MAADDFLLGLESMKIENELLTDGGVTITTVAVSEGDSVDMVTRSS